MKRSICFWRNEAMAKPLLVLGTGNRKKGEELSELFSPIGLEVKTMDQLGGGVAVEEDGSSFAENAAKKATEQAKYLQKWVLGEDSGIMVDALGGKPGIFSARFAGENASDDQNNEHLLKLLDGKGVEKRTARYVCHMTLSDPEGNVRGDTEAYCRGRVRFKPEGTHGFGYDPLFEVIEYHRTFGVLSPRVKRCLSHRSRAARQLIPELIRLVDAGEWVE
jgi:XTP/dITP diphosphohydrolase